MKYIYIMLVVALTGLLAGCNLASAPETPTTFPSPAPTLAFVQSTPTLLIPVNTSTTAAPPSKTVSTTQAVLDCAAQIVLDLKEKDMTALSDYVDPQMGLRFSPYAAVQDKDQLFPADKVAGIFSDNTVYNWGAYQASGLPIDLTFADYYAKFIYDVDFASAPQISLNSRLGKSTTLDNAAEFYSGAMIVEYHFPGFDLSLEGMDWRSLRMVFLQDNDTWYLVGIIHDQWTT